MENHTGEDIKPCLSCFAPNLAAAAVCPNCGAIVGMLDGVDPIQNLAAEGRVYHLATERTTKMVLVGTWILFSPAALFFSIVAIATAIFETGGGTTMFGLFWITATGAMFSIFMLYRVTKNYLTRKEAPKDPDD
ncbi:MAG: hypothetical protein KDB79_11975, partial [Acidobacteria bacterium]|nr:hypothetical protein [Acidobacteriota bacterium]